MALCLRLLGGLLTEPMPDEPDAAGLLALMLLTDGRRAARAAADGSLVSLPEQDRGRWIDLEKHHLYQAIRADLLERLSRTTEAAASSTRRSPAPRMPLSKPFAPAAPNR